MDPQTSPSGRPRAHSRSFSLRSDKSGEKTSHDLADKARRDSLLRGETKANPNAALTEAQPGTRNVMEKVTLDSLRDKQFKDANGNIISEPDLSNPTRPRWERPLDTIRSFEKAIDGGYKRRSMSRAASDFDSSNYSSHQNYTSKRSSYYGGNGYESGPSPNRYSQSYSQNNGGYYGSRRSDMYSDGYGQPPNAPPSRNRYGRSFSENRNSFYGNGDRERERVQGQHMHNMSYDASGSDSTGPWNYSTDPSSENSSLDRAHGIMKPVQTPEPMNSYGMDNFGNNPIMEEGGSGDYGIPTRRGPPPPPMHSAQPPARQTIQLGGGGGSTDNSAFSHQGGQLPSAARPTPTNEKRKSWLGRKLSRKD